MSWPANADHPGDVFSILTKQIVIARLVRAIHFSHQRKIGSPGSREKARPGDDGDIF
jgi:hypothetical protein